jgi:hypothetical protein
MIPIVLFALAIWGVATLGWRWGKQFRDHGKAP